MGLDMYLEKRHWVKGRQFGELTKQAVAALEPGIRLDRIKIIEEEVAYWRKANQIHAWFIENVGNGDDDCRDMELGLKNLTALRDLVREVIAHPETAPEKLPTRSGFFFGSTEYDEDYFDDLRDTDRMLTEIIDEGCGNDSWFVYHASW